MKRNSLPQMSNNPNPLLDLHARLFDQPIRFRDRVCEECNWSVPTFYRKMKAVHKTDNGKLIPALSNAEADMILRVFDEEHQALAKYVARHHKK